MPSPAHKLLAELITAHEVAVRAAADATACGTSHDFRAAADAAETFEDAREVFERLLAKIDARPGPAKTAAAPAVEHVTLSGRTAWTRKRWSAARGDLVRIRDDKGREVERAERSLIVHVRCADGVLYRLDQRVGPTADERPCEGRPAIAGRPFVQLVMHGTALDLGRDEYGDLPEAVRVAHEAAVRAFAVALRAMPPEAFAALPRERRAEKAKASR